MTLQVFIAHPSSKSAELLAEYFSEGNDHVWHVTTPQEASDLLSRHSPQLIIFNLHLLNNGWQTLLPEIKQNHPKAKLLITTDYPDPQQETFVKEKYDAHVFLRQPITRSGIEQALRDLEHDKPAKFKTKTTLPKVRVPVRLKITLPYVLLALVLAIAAAYVVSRVVLDTIEERFTNQLIEVGKLANDWMVSEEDRLLETQRLVAFSQGLPEAVLAQDPDRLREMVLPLAVNSQEEAIEILDNSGASLLSLHHTPGGNAEDYAASRGDTVFREWDFVQNVLNGIADFGRDKHIGLAYTAWGDYLYVAGPIRLDGDKLVGVVLVGKSLPTMARQIRQETLGHITFFDLNGNPLYSTLPTPRTYEPPLTPQLVSTILNQQDETSMIRPVDAASIAYSEILGPWEVREFVESSIRTNNDLGIIGTALAQTFLARPSQITRAQIFMLTTVAFILVITLGLLVAQRITNPLLRVVTASEEVAQGNLEVQVDASGNDEVAILAHSFNQMVSGLREGSIYRDLLGRTVSPEVREELRHSFAAGDIRLDGQESVATVMVSDIRGFTTLSETQTPETVLNWLNEYFAIIVPIIADNDGVISKFDGDAILAFFGILPKPMPPQESAFKACNTAIDMLKAIDKLNDRRLKRGEPPFSVGIGINTGPVVAGGLGSTERIHYTIIGDTVNTTPRLEGLTRQFGTQNNIVISQHTLFALRDLRHNFELLPMGVHTLKGKEEQLLIYQLSSKQPQENN